MTTRQANREPTSDSSGAARGGKKRPAAVRVASKGPESARQPTSTRVRPRNRREPDLQTIRHGLHPDHVKDSGDMQLKLSNPRHQLEPNPEMAVAWVRDLIEQHKSKWVV